MNNKGKTNLAAAAVLLPSIVAVALIPVLMRVNMIATTLKDTYRLFGGTIDSTDSGTEYILIDCYSQCKGLAVVVIALIMLGAALICCRYLFGKIEKRSLVYVGCSLLFVVMALISAANSEYQSIAFNGEYDRAEGFWTLACYFVMFLFTMYAFKTGESFKFISIALFIAVGINFIMAVFQLMGNNLLGQDWFKNLIMDKSLAERNLEYTSAGTNPYGALYNPNYVGSFGGLIIPLFTVMAIYTKEKLWRILYIIFDALAVTFLVMSTARSGMVAVAAALAVGIVVFARQIGKHWKLCISLAAGAAVCVTGLNFALGNKLFVRISSLASDTIELILPADEEDKDLFSKLPLREINIPNEGAIEFAGQSGTMYLGYDAERSDFTFTNENGENIPSYTVITFNDTDFSSVRIAADYANKSILIASGELSALLNISDDGSLEFSETQQYIPASNGDSIETDELGLAEINISGEVLYARYDTQYCRLFFTDASGSEVSQNEVICFSDENFEDIRFWFLDADENAATRDVFTMSFYGDTANSLFFQMKSDNKFQMLHYRTADKFEPVNAEHIGFEGKEKLGSSRGYIWSRTLSLLKNCLITGYGADTFAYYFPQNDVLAKYYSYQDYDQGFYVTVDKPHNMYLQIFCNNGLIALIAFLGIVAFYLADSLKLYALKREYRPEQIMGTAVMLGVVGYLAAGFFNDSVVHVAPVFWVLLGVGAALNTINRRAEQKITVTENNVPAKEKSEDKRMDEDVNKLLEMARAMRSGNAVINSPQDSESCENNEDDG